MEMTRPAPHADDGLAVRLIMAMLRVTWTLVRIPVMLFLEILEPFVAFLLMGFATVGVLTCLFYEFLIRDPHFPFWECMAISLASAALLIPYYALIRLFSLR